MTEQQQNPPKDEAMERLLTSVSEEWTRESAPADRSAFLARVRAGMTEVPSRPQPVAVRPRHRVVLAMAAAAALAAALTAAFLARPRADGTLLYAEPGFAVPERVAAGAVADAAAGGGMLELDARRVLLHLNTGSRMRVEAKDVVYLEKGELWTTVRSGSGFFQVRTPQGSVTVHGTEFGVAVGDGHTAVSLLNGSVSFTGPGGGVTLQPGDRAALAAGTPRPVAEAGAPTAAPPAWALAMRSRAASAEAARYYPSGRPAAAEPRP